MNLNGDVFINTPRSQSSTTSISQSNQEEYNNNREEVKIKDLLAKIQVLRNGVIEERKKNVEQEKEIERIKTTLKDCESTINLKENLIINLSKEKYELQSKLDIEKQKNIENASSMNQFSNLFTGIFKRESSNGLNDQELKRLINENKDLQIENAILKKKVEDQSLDFDKCKIEYQNLINLQITKMKQLEQSVTNKNKALDENTKKLDIMFDNFKKFDIEKTKYESDINELKKENKIREDKIVELLLKLEDREQILSSYKDSLSRHEVESAELARKLAELKNAIIETNMVIQTFRCERIGALFNTTIDITFGRTDDNEYIMTIKEEGGSEEFVNVEDVDYLKTHDKFLDVLELCYLKNGKQIKSSILLPTNLVPKMQQVYKDYLQKAIKTQNNLYY